MILSFVCTLVLSQDRISYETTAKRIPVVLAELETKLNRKLVSTGEFKNEVLILRADNVPPQDLLDRIAEVSTARWEKESDKLVLKPDALKRKAQESERMAKRIEKIATLLDKYERELEPTFDRAFLEEGAQIRKGDIMNGMFRSGRRAPISRLAIRCMLAAGAERLAKIEAGDRLVLSTSPTKMQSPLPDQEKVLALYFQEQSLYDEARAQDRERLSLAMSTGSQRNRRSENQILEKKFDSMRISIYESAGTNPRVEVAVVYNTLVEQYDVPLYENTMGLPAPTSDEPETPIEISPEGAALGELLSGSYYNSPHPVLTDAKLTAVLKDPVGTDPLSYDSQAFLAYAAAKKLNLAVLANDGILGRCIYGKLTHRSFVTRNKPFMNSEVKDGWLCMQPSSPVEARTGRDDRAAIRELVNSKSMGADVRGRYLMRRPFGLSGGLGAKLAGLFFEDTTLGDFATSEDVQRLYGSMSQIQRQNRTLPVSAMSASQKVVANRLVYGRPGKYVNAHKSEWYNEDSTTLFAAGLPTNLAFAVEHESVPIVLQHYSGQDKRLNTMGLQLYSAAMDWFWEQNPSFVKGETKFKSQLYVPGSRQMLNLYLPVEPEFHWTDQLSEVVGNGKAIHPKDFGEPHRSEIQKLIDQFNEMVKAGHPPIRDSASQGQRTNPPPPSR